MNKEQWLANYERSEECSRMIDGASRVCEKCGKVYAIGDWWLCPHDKPYYSWYFKGDKK
jgi:hypothetical protein